MEIVIRGYTKSGKTTIAREIARHLVELGVRFKLDDINNDSNSKKLHEHKLTGLRQLAESQPIQIRTETVSLAS